MQVTDKVQMPGRHGHSAFDRVLVSLEETAADRPLAEAARSLSLGGSLRLLSPGELAAREPAVPVAKALCRVAARWGADLLAFSVARHGASADVHAADLARTLTHRSPVPVLLTDDRPVDPRGPSVIGVALDEDALSRETLDAAASLALRFDATVEIVARRRRTARPSKRLADDRLERLAAALPVTAHARLVDEDEHGPAFGFQDDVDLIVVPAGPISRHTSDPPSFGDLLIAARALPLLVIPAGT